MSLPLLMIILSLYLLSMSLSFLYLRKLNFFYLRCARWAVFLGLAVHLGFYFSWLTERGSAFPSTVVESQLAISSFLAVVCGALTLRRSTLIVNFVLFPLLTINLLFFFAMASEQVAPELPHSWLWTHIVLTTLGEALLVFSAAVSAVYLCVDAELRKGRVRPWMNLLSSLPALDRLMGEGLLSGFVALSLGMILGVGFAQEFWSGKWAFDPKVVFCFLTWLLYALALGLRKWRSHFLGRRTAWLALIGLISILILSWGMDSVVSTQHRLKLSPNREIQP